MSDDDRVSLVDGVTALAVGVGQAVIKPVRPNPGPATQRWGVGVGEVAASLPKLPGLVRGIARQLNQFGSVVVSPGGIEFDGDEVAWSKVTEIRTRRLLGYLFTDAVTKQVDRLPVWWFPGRALVLSGLTHGGTGRRPAAGSWNLHRLHPRRGALQGAAVEQSADLPRHPGRIGAGRPRGS
jgi:hypothetical protein